MKMNRLLLLLPLLGLSSNASADWLEDLGKLYLAKETIEQVESREIVNLGLPNTFVEDEIDRTLRAQRIKAETIIAIEKSQIRRKIKDCVNHQVRDCR
jgi:hypothetical protein